MGVLSGRQLWSIRRDTHPVKHHLYLEASATAAFDALVVRFRMLCASSTLQLRLICLMHIPITILCHFTPYKACGAGFLPRVFRLNADSSALDASESTSFTEPASCVACSDASVWKVVMTTSYCSRVLLADHEQSSASFRLTRRPLGSVMT